MTRRVVEVTGVPQPVVAIRFTRKRVMPSGATAAPSSPRMPTMSSEMRPTNSKNDGA